jgi:hypothetical protein
MIKKIILGLLVLLALMQFIRPPRNNSNGISENDISKQYGIPEAVHSLFTQKCYDCHSNHTRYPWYSNIQPLGWWMYLHIQDGKKELNFSDFKNYSEKRAAHKLEEIVEVIREKEMPLKPYVWAHPQSQITSQEEQAIVNWIASLGIAGDEKLP